MDNIHLNIDFTESVNLAVWQNRIPVIRSITIENASEQSFSDIKLLITAEPAFLSPLELHLDELPAGQSRFLDKLSPAFSFEFFTSLSESATGTLFAKAFAAGVEISTFSAPIRLDPADQWRGRQYVPELLCAYITPNAPEIPVILRDAARILSEWGKPSSFSAYQANSVNSVRLQMAAIYTALLGYGITYCEPPASFELTGQRIRLSDSIMNGRLATCLDLTLLYCSCLEAVGLNPIIIMYEGHASAACWLCDDSFSESVQDDPSLLTKRMAEGVDEICAVECVGLTAKLDFDAACAAAAENFTQKSFELFICVKRARCVIKPIPSRIRLEDGTLAYAEEVASTEQPDYSAPVELRETSVQEDKEMTRQQLWERKLLDLSLRNTLVSFRVTKNAVQLLCTGIEALENSLSDGCDMTLLPRPSDFSGISQSDKIYEMNSIPEELASVLESDLSSKRLRTFMTDSELAASVKSLYRAAKVSIEENGTNTLYLALGYLRWYESDVSEKPRYAPLVLVPVDLIRKSAAHGYVLRIRDEDTQMNVTVLEMLRQDFGINVTSLDPLPQDESGTDLRTVFAAVRRAVMDKKRWEVVPLAFLGLFSFSQFIMWNDIRSRSDELKKNKIVASLVENHMTWEEAPFTPASELDVTLDPTELALPIPADSSQLAAVCAAHEGKSFVLHGPPGTGKSQTITNIIADALFAGKSVLFVAEKMAALSVVENRLSKLGISPFCLELHSNKAKKKYVLEQLETALETRKSLHQPQFASDAKRLAALKKELNGLYSAIHTPRSFGFSLYDAIVMLERVKDAPEAVALPDGFAAAVTSEQIALQRDIIRESAAAARECDELGGHPLLGFKKLDYSQSLEKELESLLRESIDVITALVPATEKICALTGIEKPLSLKKNNALEGLCRLIGNSAGSVPSEFICLSVPSELADLSARACTAGRRRDELSKKLNESFTNDVFSLNAAELKKQFLEANAAGFLSKPFKLSKLLKRLRACSQTPKAIVKTSLAQYIDSLCEREENARLVEALSEYFTKHCAALWNSGATDWNRLEAAAATGTKAYELSSALSDTANAAGELRGGLAASVFADVDGFRAAHGDEVNEYLALRGRLSAALSRISDLTGSEPLSASNDYYNEELSLARLRLDGLEGLRAYSIWLDRRSRLCAEGLGGVAAALESGAATSENIENAYLRTAYSLCAESIISSDKALSAFSGTLTEDKIASFRSIGTEFEQLTKNELVARLSEQLPAQTESGAATSEVSILRKAIKSGGRALSIRKLFESIPTLLRRLCPCMLMSPISVAQYIDPAYPRFDLVIFDEASQLPTSSAVGAIARGVNAVIVGDPKQLPPTSFFTVNRTDEENLDKDDLESILDDCLAVSMPEEHLLWHYRSRHESLIAFSNMQYYDNKLLTFPSPNDLVSKVRFIPVEGCYDRGGTKQNRAEAEAVVAEIVRRLKDPELKKSSIGVVTFSSVQQNLIDDLLVEAFAAEPALEEYNNSCEEPLFIKNLENVQGDERDVILFSIGYGPDAKGKVTMNFGPLNREGGWRRLNVAVSRARREMLVFSVLDPSQLDLNTTAAEGVAGLKAFLSFAKNGKGSLPVRAGAGGSSGGRLETVIAEKLRDLGYEVKTNVGSSAFKVDIGIIDPKNPDNYILGLLCDDASDASATARDRCYAQASVLEGLGWRVCRVWLLDWWFSPDKVISRIQEEIRNAENSAPIKKVETVITLPEVEYAEETAPKSRAAVYKLAELDSCEGGIEAFILPESKKKIVAQIYTILNAEAPISKSLLRKRVLTAWDISRVTPRLEKIFDDILDELAPQLTKNATTSAVFVWSKLQTPEVYDCYRTPRDSAQRRSIEDIPTEELAAAVHELLINQLGMSRVDLVRQTYRVFGFTRTSEYIENAVSDAISYLSGRGLAKLEGDKVILG